MSPDTRFVAEFREKADGKREVSLYRADTGGVIATHPLPDKTMLTTGAIPDAFTPAGDYLLMQARTSLGPEVIYAISTRTGAIGLVDFPTPPRIGPPRRLLLPVPGDSKLIAFRQVRKKADNPAGVTVMDLRTKKETPITGFDLEPGQLFYDKAVHVSPNGRYVLARKMKGRGSRSRIEVCDWRTNKKVFELSEKMVHYTDPRFTADGKRFVVVRNADYYLLSIPGGKSNVPDSIDLYDIATSERIGRFRPADYGIKGNIATIELSGDGRALVLALDTRVYVVEFDVAFGVDPLPSVVVGAGGYPLPVKPVR